MTATGFFTTILATIGKAFASLQTFGAWFVTPIDFGLQIPEGLTTPISLFLMGGLIVIIGLKLKSLIFV